MGRRTGVRWILVCAAAVALHGASICRADTACGDEGHYLEGDALVLLNNPTGRPFGIEIRRFQWWIGGGWNRTSIALRVTAPDGTCSLQTNAPVGPDGFRWDSPGIAGVHTVEVTNLNNLNFWWLRSTLDQSVVFTGRGEGDAVQTRWFLANPFVPRRWTFWVPHDATEFRLVSQNSGGRSQREDHGFTVFSPRGQRMAVLWGQANPDDPTVKFGDVDRRCQVARVLVEPGSAGRFWSVEVRFGDSHNYSDINLALLGVPPYVSRSPEEWFDGSTGRGAPIEAYDTSEFVQSDRSGNPRTNLVQHWTPCPAFGDPDGMEMLCPARIALWNPEGRELKLCMATYLPRNALRTDPTTRKPIELPDSEFDHALLRIAASDARIIHEDRVPLKTQHAHGPPYARTLKGAKGVLFLDVDEAEHFWTYTYPATPAVLVGASQADGSARFRMEVGSGRSWFFLVPAGLTGFVVRASVSAPGDVLQMEVNAPDRTVELIYGNRGERAIRVPPGTDGKLWHVRVDTASATRLLPWGPRLRFPSLQLTLELAGVPPYLSPTWEQWFDPGRPRPATERAGGGSERDRQE